MTAQRTSRESFLDANTIRTSSPASLPIPEPDLTPEEMLARAVALRPLLRAKQAECERGGKVPDDVNARLVEAGFYRAVQPRRFGGYEFSAPDFYRIMMEIG